jgi:hypothetical protein
LFKQTDLDVDKENALLQNSLRNPNFNVNSLFFSTASVFEKN